MVLARHCVCCSYVLWFLLQSLAADGSHRNCTCTAQAHPTTLCIRLVMIPWIGLNVIMLTCNVQFGYWKLYCACDNAVGVDMKGNSKETVLAV